jgi:hypothetical protein
LTVGLGEACHVCMNEMEVWPCDLVVTDDNWKMSQTLKRNNSLPLKAKQTVKNIFE